MGLTKYNLDRLRDSENDIKRITKNIDNISGAFKEIYKYIDFDVKMRDNIYGKFNDLIKDIENLVEQTNNADQIINKAIFLYSDGEQQINVLFNGVTDIANMFFDNHKGETKSTDSKITDISFLQRWFRGIKDYFKSGIEHIKDFLDEKKIRVNNKDYSKAVDNKDIEIKGLSTFQNNFDYAIEDRIKKIQQYIKTKGINIEVTGKLDRATLQASQMIGIDELKEKGLIDKDSYTLEDIEVFKYLQNDLKNINKFYRNQGGQEKSEIVNMENIKKSAIVDVRNILDKNLLKIRTNIVSIWDEPGISHTLLEGCYGKNYYNFLAGEIGGLEAIKLLFDIADNTYSGYLSFQSAVEATGGNLYFAVPLSFAIFIINSNENMPGEKPSDIEKSFGWIKARKKKVYRSAIEFKFVMESDYRYLMNLNGYKKVMIRDLTKMKRNIQEDNITLYEEEEYNKVYKNSQIEYIDHLIEMNKNEKKYSKQLRRDIEIIDNYIKKQQYK